MERIELSAYFPVPPAVLYEAWLSAERHGEMTGAEAEGSGAVGERFTAWDGYIVAVTTRVEPGARIVQRWRTSDFDEAHADSEIELQLIPEGEGTRLLLVHRDIPAGSAARYAQGWQDYYFTPMAAHFRG